MKELKNANKKLVIPFEENRYQVLEDIIHSTKNKSELLNDNLKKSDLLNTQNIKISSIEYFNILNLNYVSDFVIPRMSNAYAKKHGLDPRNDPKHNMKIIMDAGILYFIIKIN